jgi:phosphomevalonate kinase
VKARAPGKLVISGAYAVLEGAPAVAVAVDRHATADTERDAERSTPEIDAAVARGDLKAPPWFDAAPLRTSAADGDRKLGLGSSAAILVAAIAADALDADPPPQDLASYVFPRAIAAHRQAQHGGSGVDVAASCFGGVVRCKLGDEGVLAVASWALPGRPVIEVFAYQQPSTTGAMVAAVRGYAKRDADDYTRRMAELGAFAEQLTQVTTLDEGVAALAAQYLALDGLGLASGVPIVGSAGRELSRLATAHGACFGPAGAGGGDVAVWLGFAPSPQKFRARATQLGLSLLPVCTGVRGVHRIDE